MQARFLKKVVGEYEILKSRCWIATQTGESSLHHSVTTAVTRSDPSISSNIQMNNHLNHTSSDQNMHNADITDSRSLVESQANLGTNLFADRDMWENFFSDAGFWTGEGIFLSDNL